MSRRDNKSRERFLSIIILLISGLGFIAGILFNNSETEANTLYEDAAEYELTAESMTLFVQSLYQTDIKYFESADAAFHEARTLIFEWQEILALSLPADMENLENATHKEQILGKFLEGYSFLFNSIAWDLWEVFNRTDGPVGRTLANHFTHRFAYTITREIWNSINDTYPIVIPIPAATFVNETTGAVSEDLLLQITSEISHLYFFELNKSAYQVLLNQPLFEARDLAHQTLQNANLISGRADTLGITVSFTTVAVVLSSAMTERIDKKKLERSISRVRADMKNDESLLSGERDRIASLGLIIAMIIAVTGFLMTIPSWIQLF